MRVRGFATGIDGRAALRRAGGSLALLLAALLLLPPDALAQRPFRLDDPFYRTETARRDFYDHLALTGEISYRNGATLQDDGIAAASDLALRLRLDYQVAPRLDVGAVFDAVGGNGGRRVMLSWVVLKYYRYFEQSDYAFRLAVDPSSDGLVGFPQVDVAFLYTSLLSPLLSTDFAMGVRRVNLGYAQIQPPALPEGGPFVFKPRTSVLVTRALGSELHLMMNYNLHFDPAGSNLFIGLLGEGGQYELVETERGREAGGGALGDLETIDAGGSAVEQRTPFRGGAVWARGGIEFKRPSYQILPFVSVPLQQWNPEDGDWPVARLHAGVQLMLR